MTKGIDLYHLQCLDSENDTRQRRLKEVQAALGENKALQQARSTLESTHTQIRKSKVRQHDLELEIQGVSDETTRFEQQLYSGAVKNPKELADLQAKIASLKRRRQNLEDDLLEAMIELEEAESTHSQAQKHLDETQVHWEAQQADLLAEQETLQEKLTEIEQAQAGLLPKIDPGDLATYRALRHGKGGLAVVQMQSGSCGGCGITISPSLKWRLRQGELIYCGNCERISQ
ncbi:MAG: hypothetical protein B6I35_08395 [Anaerolineaceae bacterium 4572_32.2]|nr:MAG: hypothetical protein B6I35_08395 [Anaerolineaceae bacterium 4572_32.2]